jgi:cytidylate kinase
MAIITISRGSFCNGEEVAERVAKRLGYRCLSDEVIPDASERFRVPQLKLEKAFHDAPSIFERFIHGKRKHIAYVAAEILAQLKNDDTVYHGPAGHLSACGISHLLKVRILADEEERISLLMEREAVDREQAIDLIRKQDRVRKAWNHWFYGVDPMDPALYDLTIRIHRLTVDNAVDLICETVQQPQFKATPQSQEAIENLALAAGIKATLLVDYPDCEVVAEGKSVEICVRFTVHTDTLIADKIKERVLKLPGVSSVSIKLIPGVLFT